MEKEDKRIWYSIFYLICVVLFLCSIPFSMLFKNENLSFGLSTTLKLIAMIYMFYYIKKDGLDKPFIEKPKIKYFLLFPLIILCFSNILVALLTDTKSIQNINYKLILFGIIDAVFVSIIEETLFRGLLFNKFCKSKKIYIAILLQALIFGGIHLLNITNLSSIPTVLVQVIYTAFLGIILGVIYYKTKNIIFPIIFHFLFNVINNTIASNLFEILWDFKYFLINILIGLFVLIYTSFLMKGEIKNATENMDI